MLLRDRFKECTKEELHALAESFELYAKTSLRKAELIELVAGKICTEEVMRPRLVCLTNEELSLLRRVIKAPQDIGIDEIMDGMQLYMYFLRV